MTVLDIGNNVTVAQSLVPLTRTGSASAFNGAAVDTKGASWAVAIFLNGKSLEGFLGESVAALLHH